MKKIYNFSAGPACLPEPALKASKSAVKDYKKSGISILEMSHRSAPIVELFDDATQNLINLLDMNLEIEQNLKKNTKGLCGMNKRVYLQPLLNEKV